MQETEKEAQDLQKKNIEQDRQKRADRKQDVQVEEQVIENAEEMIRLRKIEKNKMQVRQKKHITRAATTEKGKDLKEKNKKRYVRRKEQVCMIKSVKDSQETNGVNREGPAEHQSQVARGESLASTDDIQGLKATTRLGRAGMEMRKTQSQAVQGTGPEENQNQINTGSRRGRSEEIEENKAARAKNPDGSGQAAGIESS